jgi:probable phosphoglycerate mutase
MFSEKIIPYEDIPRELYDEAQDLIWHALEISEQVERPTLIHLCGIPGSGKTTYADALKREDDRFKTFYILRFDGVMESLCGYQQDKPRLGLKDAFLKWQMPARFIGYHLLQALIEGQRNFIFDNSASFQAHIQLIETMRQKYNYYVEMHRMVCPLPVAMQLVVDREAVIQRHTPPEFLADREKVLDGLIPKYQRVVDKFIEVDTTKSINR